MPSQTVGDYYQSAAHAEVPEFDISVLSQYSHHYDQLPHSAPSDEWYYGNPHHHHHHQGPFKQELPGPIPVPKSEPISELDYFESGWAPLNSYQPPQHLPGSVHNHLMAYNNQVGSPSNQQLQLSDPPTPAAECQVTSTNLSPMHSPYSPHSEVGSYDGAAHGESFFEGASHFDNTELNEVNIKGLTEEQLVSLTARDLNRICREMPDDVVKQLKKRRRTLKNRGYAYNSRVRRVTQKTALESERDDLKQQIQQLTDRCRFLEKEAEQWKRKAQTLERGQ